MTTQPATQQISPEQAAVEQQLVDTVVASFDNTEDPGSSSSCSP